jgi:hypothetical protein
VDLTPPWERAQNQDSGLPAGSGGGFVVADANSAGGAGGSGAPIEGWPKTDVPLADGMDGAGFPGDSDAPGVFDAEPSGADALGADTSDGLVGGEASGANDGSPAEVEDQGADAEQDVPVAGSGGTGGSFLDASFEDVASGGGGGGGATGGSGGTSGSDGGEAEHDGTGGGSATGGSATGGSATGGSGTGGTGTGGTGTGGSGTGGSGTGGSGTGGSGTGGSGTGGSGTGGGGGVSCTGYQGRDAGSGWTEGLVAWYQCQSAAGASGNVLSDSSGSSPPNDGTLHTGAGGAVGYRFDTGKLVGNALYFVVAQKGYVTLPPGLLANACEATIATWVYVNSSQDWQRIFDFGSGTDVYMFLAQTNNVSHVLRFGITVSGNSAEQRLDGNEPLPTGSWIHVAVVLGPNGGFLYVNGTRVTSNPSMTLRPADLGNLPNLYIGRSQFPADPYFDGNVDSFRIWDRALSEEEIVLVRDYTGT